MYSKQKPVGYLTRNKSRGHTYIYLQKSKREGKKIKRENIFSFGKMPEALETMYEFREKPEIFPEKLKELGFNLDDLDEWILTIETKRTSTGRAFEV